MSTAASDDKVEDYFWARVKRDLRAHLQGHGPDCELQNVMMAHYYDADREHVSDCWHKVREEIVRRRGLAS